jgi:hypothetical protein
MNWKELNNKYPLSIRELKKAHLLMTTSDQRSLVYAGQRWGELYSFFDDHEIYLEVEIDFTTKPKFFGRVSEYDGRTVTSLATDMTYIREDSEEMMFELALEVLEGSLEMLQE